MKLLYLCPRYSFPSHLKSFADQESKALSEYYIVRPVHFNFYWLHKLEPLSWLVPYVFTIIIALLRSRGDDILYLRDGDPFLFLPLLLSLPFGHRKWAISVIGVPSLYRPIFNYHVWRPVFKFCFKRNSYVFLCENYMTSNYLRNYFLDGVLNGRVRVLPLGVSC